MSKTYKPHQRSREMRDYVATVMRMHSHQTEIEYYLDHESKGNRKLMVEAIKQQVPVVNQIYELLDRSPLWRERIAADNLRLNLAGDDNRKKGSNGKH